MAHITYQAFLKKDNNHYSIKSLYGKEQINDSAFFKLELVANNSDIDTLLGVRCELHVQYKIFKNLLVTYVDIAECDGHLEYQVYVCSHQYQLSQNFKRLSLQLTKLSECFDLLLDKNYSQNFCDLCNAQDEILIQSKVSESRWEVFVRICAVFCLDFVIDSTSQLTIYCSHHDESIKALENIAPYHTELGHSHTRIEFFHQSEIAIGGWYLYGQKMRANTIQYELNEHTFIFSQKVQMISETKSTSKNMTVNYQSNLVNICSRLSSNTYEVSLIDSTHKARMQKLLPCIGVDDEVVNAKEDVGSCVLLIDDASQIEAPLVILTAYSAHPSMINRLDNLASGNIQLSNGVGITFDKGNNRLLAINTKQSRLSLNKNSSMLSLLSKNDLETCSNRVLKKVEVCSIHSKQTDINISSEVHLVSQKQCAFRIDDTLSLKTKMMNIKSIRQSMFTAKHLVIKSQNTLNVSSDKNSLLSQGGAEIRIDNMNVKGALSIKTGASYLSIEADKVILSGMSITSPVLLLGRVVPGSVSSKVGAIENIRYKPYKKELLSIQTSISFLSFKKDKYMLDEDIPLSFCITSNIKRMLSVKITLYRCRPRNQKKYEYTGFYNEDYESYEPIDTLTKHLEAPVDGEVLLHWKINNAESIRDSFSYYRFQVSVNDFCYPNISNRIHLFKRVNLKFEALDRVNQGLFQSKLDENNELWKQNIAVNNDLIKLEYVPICGASKIYFFSSAGRQLECVDEKNNTTLPYLEVKADTKKAIEHIAVRILKPPIIINMRENMDGPFFYQDEIDTFQTDQSVTLFIHGFNIPLGAFDTYDGDIPITVKALDKKPCGAYQWLVDMEYEVNKALKNTFANYKRLVKIAWPGDVGSAIDYMLAVKQSLIYGQHLINVFREIFQYDPNIKINVIAHSQGNGLLVSALSHLLKDSSGLKLNQVFFWQSPLASNVFNQDIGTFKNCLNAVNKATIFYSKFDNVLGRLSFYSVSKREMRKIINEKPFYELIAGTFLSYLGLESLYTLANWLSVPAHALFSEDTIDKAWVLWRDAHSWLQTDGHHNKLYNSLDTQLLVYGHSKILNHLSKQLINALQHNKYHIDIILSNIDSEIEHMSLRLIYTLLTHQLFFIELLSIYCENNLHKIKKQDKYPIALIYKLACFSYVIVNTVSLSKKKAMGWYGVDKSTQHYWGNKLRVLDVSQWYYHHSALINASDAVSDHIYRDIIFDPVQGITL